MANGFGNAIFAGFKQGEDIRQSGARQRAQQLGLDQKAMDNQRLEAEKNRFLERSNLESMVQGALEFSAITGNDVQAQNNFLKRRVQEIQSRGGNPQDTLELLNMNPEQRKQIVQGVIQIGERAGILQPKAPLKQETTTLIKNLEAQGLIKGTPEFREAIQRQLGKPTGTTVQVDLGKSEQIERGEIGKVQARRYEKVVEAGENARNTLAALDQLDNIDVNKGIFEPAKVELARVLSGLGFDEKAKQLANVATAQSFNAVSERLVNEVLNTAKGPQTDQDAERARKTIAQLSDDPRAAAFKNDAMRALALRKIEQQEFIEDRVDRGQTFSQAVREWNKFKKETPSLGAIIQGVNNDLPIFVFQYRNIQRKINPNITEEEILDKWRRLNGR